MKIKVSVVIAFILWFASHRAQAQKFEGGVQGGFNLCQVDGDQNGGYNMLALNGGIFVHYILEDNKHSFGFDISYMGKGSRSPRDETNFNPILIYRYHYVEMPFYYRYNQEKYALRAGLNWAYLINSYLDDGGSKKEILYLRNTDILGHIGAEYHLNDKFSIFGSYQYSIRSIVNINQSALNVPLAQFRRNGVYHDLIQLSLKYYLTR